MPKILVTSQSAAPSSSSQQSTSSQQKLIYPAGCKEVNEDLPTDDLIRRLKDIAMAFQQMSQEEDNSCYIPLALYLATDFFLEHQSRDVRLLVACAIADVFRVYAPNAPYQHPNLIKRIFLFFIQQLRGLQDPKDATFKRYFYLLENLAWVKSFNICIELDDSQSIFCQLFSLIFKIVNENHSEKVKNFMLDMLTPLIIEADTVSSKLIEIILWQIIDPKKTQNKQACFLATQILKKTSKTMEPYLISYFNNAITHGVHANAGEISDDEEEESSQQTAQVKSSRANKSGTSTSVTQLCELIYELNQICPSVMEGILPQLEFKIRSNEERERCEFTKLLARLFSDKNSNLAEQYSELWKSFLGRFRDISITVRMRCVQYSMHFLVNHPELRDDITEQLKQRQHDPDENVRYEVVMAIISAAKKGIENINEDLLSFVKERTLDKKFKIRREALYGMAQLYKQYNVAAIGENQVEITSDLNVNSALKMLNWIKNKCLHNYYQTLLDDRLLVERILHTCLIPYSLPLAQRMKTLYIFYATIDAHAARAFNELLRQQQGVRKQVKEVLDILKDEKTDERDALLRQKIQQCAKNLPEPVKADEYLTKLCRNLELNPALRQHMEIIVASTSYPQVGEDGTIVPPPPCSTIEASVKEVLKSLGFPVQTNSFYVIIKQLMERIAPVMIDYQGLIFLFDYVSDSLLGDGVLDAQFGIENSAKRGLQLIHSLSSVFPAIFYGREIFTDYLLPFLWHGSDNPQIGEIVLQILTNIGASAGSYPIQPMNSDERNNVLLSIPWWAADDDVIPRLIDKFILKAASTKQAKYAIQCLNAIIQDDNEKMKIFGQILDQIKAEGLTLETHNFRTHLVTIGMIATCGGHVFFPKLLRSIIQKFVVQNLLLKDQRLQEEIATQEENEKQRDNSDVFVAYEFCSEEVKCKVEGIKLMVRWLYGLKLNTLIASPENQQEVISNYQKRATNTLQLLKTIIQNGGDLNEQNLGGTTLEKAFLRLAAASAMIKIVSNDAITAATTTQGDTTLVSASSSTSQIISAPQLHVLSTVLLDQEEFVREKFAAKLHKGLMSLSLGLEFLAILCLGGTFDNNLAFKNKLRSYLLLNLAKRRDLVKSKGIVNLKAVLPDCVLPYIIHLLAHMPFYTQYDDVSQLEIVKECLWFIMEPLVLKNEHFSFSFYKRTFENIKTCVDRVSASALQESDSNGTANSSTMTTMVNYKIYCACDLALGLVMSKTQNFLLKDFPVQPSLPGKYYMVSSAAADNNLKCYLPPEMQFAPPKRCGLEAEILGKITKSFTQNPVPPSNKGRNIKSNQLSQSTTQQIVVLPGENIVEEGVVVEQANENKETSQTVVNPQPRSRKQDLGAVLCDDSEKDVEPPAAKKIKSEPTVSTRPTRAASKASSQEKDDSKNQDNVPAKRRRGRPPKNPVEQQLQPVKETKNEDDATSPTRKSARIAKKVPSNRSQSPSSPEPAPTRGGRGRGRGRGGKH
ncbi:hypothetical protein B4U79_10779 [Dinothrombium tinctorium]|uniref:Uncharacterized protein n=1 Tax=Dinothrombium tinctorium TaxID=1965070 RepID=A0A3S3PJI9_9ACAR|nr:hypothetical protein B4U79_10779 [Dinothrombium tinctorium]